MDTQSAPTTATISPNLSGEEHVRLVTGFADLFTALIVLIGGYTFTIAFVDIHGALAGLVMAGLSYALSKPFVVVRNFAATAIVLAAGFFFGIVMIGASFGLPALGYLLGGVAAWFYWKKFAVPIAASCAIAAPFFAIIGFNIVGTGHYFGPVYSWLGAVSILSGLILFAIAMWWDSTDRARQTRRSDVAFWLHLFAAPMVVHGLFSATGLNWYSISNGQLLPILILFALIAIVSLIVDRRPMLVSSLSYVAVGLAAALERNNPSQGMMIVTLVLGTGVLILSVGWNFLRNLLIAPLPAVIKDKIPAPVEREPAIPDVAKPESEKEPLRLVFGFNDIFVAIGIQILMIGACMLSYQFFIEPLIAASDRSMRTDEIVLTWGVVVAPAIAILATAEYFVRHRRMALPAIQLALWLGLLALCIGYLVARTFVSDELFTLFELRNRVSMSLGKTREEISVMLMTAASITAIISAGANLLFGWRYRVPLSLSLAFASLSLPFFMMAKLNTGMDARWVSVVVGLVVFGLAVMFDRTDPERKTQRNDAAFWMFLTGSLFTLPALFSLVAEVSMGMWLAALLFMAVVAASFVLDRRAPILVALPSLLVALSLRAGGTMIVLVALCALLLALILYWDQARNLLFNRPETAPAE